ncbi:MAG: M20/M25/M40 family metallo-hydrolase [Planctomycetota bacterium]|jgi:acetylornithine deacetylase/succinyl-diaminopimelate desuccinylase-like protein
MSVCLRSLLVATFLPSLCLPARAADSREIDVAALEAEAVQRLQKYLRIDTVNPPGNELRAVEFFARIFQAEGIACEKAETAPGRGNIWARLPGGSEPDLVLLHHTDVVPADADYWSVPPLSGVVRDGHLYGRGALDMKTIGILHLETFLALHRMKKPLKRDVLFVATADEEAGGRYGAGWLVKHRPELFKNAGILLNEGGAGVARQGTTLFTVQVTEKVPLWLRLVATGEPGHGSTPRAETAVTRLIRALGRIEEHPFPPRITPPVDAFFKALAPHVEGPSQNAFLNMPAAVRNPGFLKTMQRDDHRLHALTRNTCSITRLEGSSKINVVPAKAWAELDCRLLPDQDPEEFLDELRTIIDDPAVTVEKLMVFSPAVSTTETDLYRAIETVCRRHFPEAPVIPSVSAGFTDSHYFRDLGLACYGFAPMVTPSDDIAGIHGNNERISLENVRLGTRLMLEIVREVVY